MSTEIKCATEKNGGDQHKTEEFHSEFIQSPDTKNFF